MRDDLARAAQHERLEALEAVLAQVVGALVLELLVVGRAAEAQEERHDLVEVAPEPVADRARDRADRLDERLDVAAAARAALDLREERLGERVEERVREHDRERAEARGRALLHGGLVVRELHEHRVHDLRVVRLELLAEAPDQVGQVVEALELDLDRRARRRGDARKQPPREQPAHARAHRGGHIGDERLEADRVDVAQLVLALEHERAQLVADFADLRLLHLAEQHAEAFHGDRLHVVAAVVELLQHGRADPAEACERAAESRKAAKERRARRASAFGARSARARARFKFRAESCAHAPSLHRRVDFDILLELRAEVVGRHVPAGARHGAPPPCCGPPVAPLIFIPVARFLEQLVM